MSQFHDLAGEEDLADRQGADDKVLAILRTAQVLMGLVAIGVGLYVLVVIFAPGDGAPPGFTDDAQECASIIYSHKRLLCYDQSAARKPPHPAKGANAPFGPERAIEKPSDH